MKLKDENIRKKLHLCDNALVGREVVLHHYIHLLALEETRADNLPPPDSPAKGRARRGEDKRLRAPPPPPAPRVAKDELIFVVDMLIELVKHTQASEELCTSLSVHLLPDMESRFTETVKGYADNKHADPEFIFTNFLMRSHRLLLVHDQTAANGAFANDMLFDHLYKKVTREVLHNERYNGCVSEFLGVHVRLMQRNCERHFLLLDSVEYAINQMTGGNASADPVVFANSLPHFLLFLMFFREKNLEALRDKHLRAVFSSLLRFLDNVR